jgi:hypothetical protein
MGGAVPSDPENAFPGSGHMKLDEEELARAKRRVRELEEEVEAIASYIISNRGRLILRQSIHSTVNYLYISIHHHFYL